MNYYAFSILEAEERLAKLETEHDIAALYADVSHKYRIVEDEEYDFRPGTKQYAWAVEHTERWEAILQILERKIFDILQNEGVTIPETKRIDVLIPFMKRNGYTHSSCGWSCMKGKFKA